MAYSRFRPGCLLEATRADQCGHGAVERGRSDEQTHWRSGEPGRRGGTRHRSSGSSGAGGAAERSTLLPTRTGDSWMPSMPRFTIRVRKPSVISISWGAPENRWTPQSLNAFNAAFQDAALLGITIRGASGTTDLPTENRTARATWTSLLRAPGCWLVAAPDLIARGNMIQSETVWNDERAAQPAAA